MSTKGNEPEPRLSANLERLQVGHVVALKVGELKQLVLTAQLATLQREDVELLRRRVLLEGRSHGLRGRGESGSP